MAKNIKGNGKGSENMDMLTKDKKKKSDGNEVVRLYHNKYEVIEEKHNQRMQALYILKDAQEKGTLTIEQKKEIDDIRKNMIDIGVLDENGNITKRYR